MATEIERKFLVKDQSWRRAVSESRPLRQGYLCAGQGVTVRVRLKGDSARLTIKGGGQGLVRPEYEYPVPLTDAREMLDQLCGDRIVAKTRHLVPLHGHTWEVDVFSGANEGLILAELELSHPDESYVRPPWLGQEVSGDPRYFNAYLATHPWREWGRS